MQGFHRMLVTQLKEMLYSGQLRSYPQRHLAFAKMKDTNWYAGGGNAWDIVMNDETIRDAVNNWLSDPTKLKTPYRLEIRKL